LPSLEKMSKSASLNLVALRAGIQERRPRRQYHAVRGWYLLKNRSK
jgi:hypothetical protein